MLKNITLTAVLILTLGLLISCSGTDGGMVILPAEERATSAESASHILWGLWQLTADPVNETLDIIPIRTAEFHLNALPFLEPPPLVNLTLEYLAFDGDLIEADIGLRHPFLGLTEFTGFDVCGILITNGSCEGFTDSNINYAGPGDTRLLNPDGHSRWWNPAEFPTGNTMFHYKDGLLGTPDSYANYNSTINGYKYFCDDLSEPDAPMSNVTLERRGMFGAGQQNIRKYHIQLSSEGLIFNYAVDANWVFPTGNFPWKAPDDFGENANRTEPWWIDVHEDANSLYYFNGSGGGGLSLTIDVYDWFNAEGNLLYIEAANGVAPQVGPISSTGGGEGYSTYEVDITDATPTAAGDLDLLITLETEGEDFENFIPGTNTSAYLVYTTTVSDEPAMELEVTGISPAYGKPDYLIEDAEVYGAGFVSGPSLGVELKKTGESDIVASNVTCQDENTIICDIDIPVGAAVGLWDVRVTNGDGGVATGDELFEIFDCSPMGAIMNSDHWEGTWYQASNFRSGLTITRSGVPYIIGRRRYIDGTWTDANNGIHARRWNNTAEMHDYWIHFATGTYPVSNMVSDSQNLIYFALNTNTSELLEIPFDPDSGFGSYSSVHTFTGWIIRYMTIDTEDNPIVLTYKEDANELMRVYHWDGVDTWLETEVPAVIVDDALGRIGDFAYNPILEHYVFVGMYPPENYSRLYAVDRQGNINYSNLDIFGNFNHSHDYRPWLCIDPDNPNCHFVVWGSWSPTGFPTQDGYRPIIRYDTFYGEETIGQSNFDGWKAPWGKGAYCPGTDRLYTGNSIWTIFLTWFELPADW